MIKNFVIQELVTKELYEMIGDRCWMLFDSNVLIYLDEIRIKYKKPMKINDWHKGGSYNESGARMLNTKTGAKKSKHKEFFAFDIKTSNMKEFYDFVTKTPGLNIVRVEDFEHTKTWVHIEIGLNKGLPTIFKP